VFFGALLRSTCAAAWQSSFVLPSCFNPGIVPVFDGRKVAYVISSNVVDDTNMKMRGTDFYSKANTVRTCMHNIQKIVVVYDSAGQESENDYKRKVFQVHQPTIILDNPTAVAMFCGFMSWLVFSAHGVGQRLLNLGLLAETFSQVRLSVVLVMGDALKANDTMFNMLRAWVAYSRRIQQRARDDSVLHAALQLRCLIHQLNLTRRPLALCFNNYWSTMVRLGHLYESSAFKAHFRDSMIAVISGSFVFRRVDQLPQASVQWRRIAIEQYRSLV
jgi:hypothetical protein